MTQEQQSAFTIFKNALIKACQADAKLEYVDEKYYKAAKDAWIASDLAEAKFKAMMP